jgi:hypothetical protein
MNQLLHLAASIGLLLGPLQQGPAKPDVPDNLRAPAGEEVILVAHATGAQIYICQSSADEKYSWVLKAPEADLTDAQGNKIIQHFAGPTWKHNDGSEVTGKVLARQDAPKPGAIPWLLLAAVSHAGLGILGRVTSIQRIHTEGGLPPKPDACTAAARGTESKSAYAADYYFYAPPAGGH